MRHGNRMMAAAAVLAWAWPAMAGRIEGQVFDLQGQGVEGLVVTYRRAEAADGSGGPRRGIARTQAEGVFVLPDLEGGDYSLCVLASTEKLVAASCGWGVPSFVVSVGETEIRKGVQMPAPPGRLIDVRVEDPGRLLEEKKRGGQERAMLIGVTGPDGFFRPLALRSGDRFGWNHQLVVPEEMEVRLHVLSTEVRLVDSGRAEHQSQADKAVLKKKARRGQGDWLQFWVEEKGK